MYDMRQELLSNSESSGTLATRIRTVAGVLGQCELFGLNIYQTRNVLQLAGLPSRAAEDPDFPISIETEVSALSILLQQTSTEGQSLSGATIEMFSAVGINYYGILGLAMQHASSVSRALEVLFAYPQLCWGHCRILMTRDDASVRMRVTLDVPVSGEGTDAETQEAYLVTRDLMAVNHLIGDVIENMIAPTAVSLPFPDPGISFHTYHWLPCPVSFDADVAEIVFPAAILDAVPVFAGDLAFRRYDKIAQAFAALLDDEEDLATRSQRLIWAYSPPPDRDRLADMLNISTRTLSRQLKECGTSYNKLLRQVQLERAMKYLNDTGMSVAKIADHLGYSEPGAFTRAFQRWVGASPLAWRNSQSKHR